MPKPAPQKRTHRGPDQLIADLQAKIEGLKARAALKRTKSNPAIRHTVAALKNMDRALAEATDNVLKQALSEARAGISAYLQLQGIGVPAGGGGPRAAPGRRSSTDLGNWGATLLDFVRRNPGQRGEHIAAALGTDANTIRRPMKQLIADGAVRTKGERRGMRYYPG
jgi:DNA-binding GntR family transcriptional regulator